MKLAQERPWHLYSTAAPNRKQPQWPPRRRDSAISTPQKTAQDYRRSHLPLHVGTDESGCTQEARHGRARTAACRLREALEKAGEWLPGWSRGCGWTAEGHEEPLGATQVFSVLVTVLVALAYACQNSPRCRAKTAVLYYM